MKKILFFFILALHISCSKSDIATGAIINTPSLSTVMIGDTIVLTGQNFDKIQGCTFVTKSESEIRFPIEQTNGSLKIKVPILHNEEFSLAFNTYGSESPKAIHFNLIGTFPLPNTGMSSQSINQIKMINEKIVYIITENKLCKTIDGGYTWSIIKTFGGYVTDMFFINENQGWIALKSSDYTTDLLFTNDGGATFNNIFSMTNFTKTISKINFTSLKNGYLLTSKGEIYQTNDNSNFNLIYDCPNSDENSSFWEFNQLSIYDNTLIACGYQASQPGLIRKINNKYDYLPSSLPITKTQLINETSDYKLMGNNLYFSNNLNDWQLTSGTNLSDFYFINQNKGLGISNVDINTPNPHSAIFETYDGGKKWINRYDFNYYGYDFANGADFYGNTGLITGGSGKIWKHIFR